MKALICRRFGTPDTLLVEETLLPPIGEEEVLIGVRACGVNFPDILMIRDAYQFKPPLPFSPGSEVAGIVLATGKLVTQFSAGDRVIALCGWGGMAEEVIVNTHRVFPLPPTIGFLAAAGSLFTYGTSYYALKDKAHIQPGETLLVLGAGGGVGLAAVELGKMMGATVIAAASSDAKLTACREKGAAYTINYSTEDLRIRLQEITGNKGVDVIYDPIGGSLSETALRSIAWKGRFLVVGFASGEIPQPKLNLVLLKGCSVIGVFWGSFAEKESKLNTRNFLQIIQWIRETKLIPVIHKVYPLENAGLALQDMADRKLIGKAIVKVGEWTDDPVPLPTSAQKEKKASDSNPVTKKIINIADISTYTGYTLGPGNWLTVTQEMINRFAITTGDDQWIHTDPEKAKTLMPGGKTIAHGYLILSLIPRFLYDLISIENSSTFVNYGINKVRFITPVTSGSRVRLQATITEAEYQSNGTVKLFLNCVIRSEGSDKPVCIAELISLIG